MKCPTCGKESDRVVIREKDWSKGCWSCVATGPLDNFLCRRVVELEMHDGKIEVHYVTAETNILAFQMADAFRPEVKWMFAKPCPIIS